MFRTQIFEMLSESYENFLGDKRLNTCEIKLTSAEKPLYVKSNPAAIYFLTLKRVSRSEADNKLENMFNKVCLNIIMSFVN